MNSFIDRITSRSSANQFDENFSISSDLRNSILSAMSDSPRAANLQQFQVRWFEKRTDLEALAACFGGCKYLKSTSLALFFFVDLRSTDEWMKATSAGTPFMNWLGYHYGFADSLMAMGAAAMFAESQDLQTRVLSHGLQRAKAAAKYFSCETGIIPSLILTVGKDKSANQLSRFNLPAHTFCVEGAGAWHTGDEIYVQSGKEFFDFETLLKRPELNAKIASRNMSVSQVMTEFKYSETDIATFSDNLVDLIVQAFRK